MTASQAAEVEAQATSQAVPPSVVSEAPRSTWGGEAELGLIVTRGNTDTDSLNMKLRVENKRPKWRHKLQLKALESSDRDVTTAKSYEALWRTEYLLDDNDYLFGSARYEDDRFSGYDYRATEVIGYGHQFLKRKDMQLKGEFGVGSRQTKNIDGPRNDETIARVGLDYTWQFTDTSSFKENVFVEHGEENTFTESITELTVRINSQLAMKLGVTVKNNSDPPVGAVNTDTKTAVTLVYDF